MTDDIVTRLRKQHTIQYGWKLGELVKHTEHNSDPQIRDRMNRCEVCEQWSPCDGIKAADEIERLRAEINSADKAAYDSLRLLYDRQLLDIKKHEAEIEYLRAENERLKHQRFDLQAADHIAESVRDVLHTARRLTDMYRLKEEEKSVPEEYEVFERKEGGQW